MDTIALFENASFFQIGLLIALYFTAFFIKGVFGLGAMPLLVILGAWIVGAHHAVSLAVVLNCLTQIQFMREIRLQADRKLAPPLTAFFALSLAVGVWIFGRLDSAGLSIVLGLGMGGFLIVDYSGLLKRIITQFGVRSIVVGLVVSALGGFLAGVTGAGGILLVSLYLKINIPDARTFRATVLLVASVIMIWRVVVFAVGGFLTPPILLESMILLPISIFGAWAGSRFFAGLANDSYFQAFRIFLIVAAFSLVWKGLV